MQSRLRSVVLFAFAALLALGSAGCDGLTRPDDIVIAPEPKRAAAPPTAPAAAPPPAPAVPHAAGAPPGSG